MHEISTKRGVGLYYMYVIGVYYVFYDYKLHRPVFLLHNDNGVIISLSYQS